MTKNNSTTNNKKSNNYCLTRSNSIYISKIQYIFTMKLFLTNNNTTKVIFLNVVKMI